MGRTPGPPGSRLAVGLAAAEAVRYIQYTPQQSKHKKKGKKAKSDSKRNIGAGSNDSRLHDDKCRGWSRDDTIPTTREAWRFDGNHQLWVGVGCIVDWDWRKREAGFLHYTRWVEMEVNKKGGKGLIAPNRKIPGRVHIMYMGVTGNITKY